MHSDPDSNPYENNVPIPNPYETSDYAAPPPSANPDNYGYAPPQQGNQYPPQQPQYPPQGNQYPPQQGGTPPTVYGPYGQQAQGAPYQYQNAPFPATYNQGNQPPQKRSSSGLRIAVIVIVVLIVIAAAVVAIAIPVHNTQVFNTNATATAQTSAYATATVAARTYPFSNNLKLNDPLSDNSHGNGWEENANCTFTNGAYHDIDSTTNTFSPCTALKSSFSDFTYQTSMQIKQGALGGLTFRGNMAQWHYYSFVVGYDGSYGLLLYTKQDTRPQTLHEGNTTLSANQPIVLGVVARGSTLGLYINKQKVASLTDSTYSTGQVGVIAYNTGQSVDAAFTNAQVWAL